MPPHPCFLTDLALGERGDKVPRRYSAILGGQGYAETRGREMAPSTEGMIETERRRRWLPVAAVFMVILYFHDSLLGSGINAGASKGHNPNQATYGAAMCTPAGHCWETPTVATPRTVYSARTQQQQTDWFAAQQQLAALVSSCMCAFEGDEARCGVGLL